MTDERTRRTGWLRRWWLAVVGLALVLVGGLVYEAAWWTVPTGSVTYSPTNGTAVVYSAWSVEPLQHLGEGLMVAGIIAVIATIALRFTRSRGQE